MPISRTVDARLAVGPVDGRFEDVSRIAVLRGGGMGDLIFALPAIQSLRAEYPDASVTLLGAPMHAALLAGRPEVVDEVQVLPIAQGVRALPGVEEDPVKRQRFLTTMADRQFDLAVQLHGGGRFSNPFLLALGARHTVGSRTPDAVALERTVPYIYYQHEVLRGLEIVGLAGARPVILDPQLPPTDAERDVAAQFAEHAAPLVVIHPGATDPRRRWPAERFAHVAERTAHDGARVIVVGDDTDVGTAREIVARAAAAGAKPGSVTSAAGALDFTELVGLLLNATVMVGNDSGPRHLAQALGVPTVGVFWVGNVVNGAPFGRARHRVHMSWVTQCPICGVDTTQVGWTAARCSHDLSFVEQIAAEPVYADVAELMATTAPRNGR
ncbi:glycosyltransferase family 9 protein [Salinibacterium sp. ZJ454]|uniref:glycosyltransferase family 9 protein n=1 Tax=Salinibacterium sp. ZJ454 TaxID=2708339 RepID=UPI0014212449|nr:glycosyltransferase family 9 protein [Salinibacterium sp. ZJ454]